MAGAGDSANPDLNKLGDCMKNDAFRQHFVDDPDGAIRSCTGKTAPTIDPRIIDALKGCSKDELDCLASVGQAFLNVYGATTTGGEGPLGAFRLV